MMVVDTRTLSTFSYVDLVNVGGMFSGTCVDQDEHRSNC
jgi:hypothetical protein